MYHDFVFSFKFFFFLSRVNCKYSVAPTNSFSEHNLSAHQPIFCTKSNFFAHFSFEYVWLLNENQGSWSFELKTIKTSIWATLTARYAHQFLLTAQCICLFKKNKFFVKFQAKALLICNYILFALLLKIKYFLARKEQLNRIAGGTIAHRIWEKEWVSSGCVKNLIP